MTRHASKAKNPWGILLAMLLILVPILSYSYNAGAVSLQDLYINYSTSNNTLTVNTMFYNLKLDADNGGITWIEIKNDVGETFTALNSTTSPYIGIYQVENDTVVKITNYSLEVNKISSDIVVAKLNKTLENNASLEIVFFFYSWTPEIDYMITYNGIQNKLIISYPVETTILNQSLIEVNLLKYTYSNLTISPMTINTTVDAENLVAIGMQALSVSNNTTKLAFFQGIIPVTPQPANLTYNLELIDNSSIRTLLLEYDVNNTTTIKSSVFLTNYLPAVLGSTPLAIILKNTGTSDLEFKILSQLKSYLNQLNTTIQNLNQVINNLRQENNNLTKQLDYYKGKVDVYKQELEKAKTDYKILKERLSNNARLTVVALIVGLILGLVGGLFVVRIRK